MLLENLAAGHLHALGQQTQVRIYYWRDGEKEVDLIYDHPEYPLAFEIGSSDGHDRSGLLALAERHPKFAGRSYLVTPSAIPKKPSDASDRIGTLPVDLFLLAVSAQAEHELKNRIFTLAPNPGRL